MSQRASGYERKDLDAYETPEWVTQALIPHLPEGIRDIWEPVCGSGKMVRVLQSAGYKVRGTDIQSGLDFLLDTKRQTTDAIVTNPPYAYAQAFIEQSISIADHVCMLLRTDYDHAKSRQYLFKEGFAKKLVLLKRIKWFEDSTGSPSFNHAWFLWSHSHKGPPVLAYGP